MQNYSLEEVKQVYGNHISNVYKPKLHPDGRYYIQFHLANGRNSTTPYARFLMAMRIGRVLKKSETVDHIDRNKANNDINNLRIISFRKHLKEDVRKVRHVEVDCVWCGDKMFRSPNALNSMAKAEKAGPFCSSRCVGAYSAYLGKGGEKFPINRKLYPVEEREYYYPKKSL